MALTDAYFTKEEFYAAVKMPIATADQDAVVTRGALTVSRFIDRITNRVWGKDNAAVERVFPHFDGDYLDLLADSPGIASLTGFAATINSASYTSASFQFRPLNALLLGQPYTELGFPSGGSLSSFYSSDGLIRITAIWGYPAVPAIVKDVGIELLSIWMGLGPRASMRMQELDQVVDTSTMANQMVNRFLKSLRRTAIA